MIFATPMILNNKTINKNYLIDEIYVPLSPNIRNKAFIDDWMNRNYEDLYNKFRRYEDRITKRDYSKCDILHESIIRLYIDKRKLKNQKECDTFLNKYFHISDK